MYLPTHKTSSPNSIQPKMSIDRVSMVVSPLESKLHIRSSTRSAKSAILAHPSANQLQFDFKNILFYFHPRAAPTATTTRLFITNAYTLAAPTYNAKLDCDSIDFSLPLPSASEVPCPHSFFSFFSSFFFFILIVGKVLLQDLLFGFFFSIFWRVFFSFEGR